MSILRTMYLACLYGRFFHFISPFNRFVFVIGLASRPIAAINFHREDIICSLRSASLYFSSSRTGKVYDRHLSVKRSQIGCFLSTELAVIVWILGRLDSGQFHNFFKSNLMVKTGIRCLNSSSNYKPMCQAFPVAAVSRLLEEIQKNVKMAVVMWNPFFLFICKMLNYELNL